jgi:hypothetical protein
MLLQLIKVSRSQLACSKRAYKQVPQKRRRKTEKKQRKDKEETETAIK